MAETMVLNAKVRQSVGSKHAVKLRKEGRIPAIVYGHKQEPVAISLSLHDFTEGLHHGHRFFEVQMGQTKETLLVKDVQYDHLGRYIIHADLVRVDLSEMVKISVPIKLRGVAKGTHEGGIIDVQLNELEVECTVTSIPEVITVDIRDIDVGDTIRAGEIELSEGIKLATDAEALVLGCHLVAAAKSTEELEEEMPVAPEVITEKEGEPAKGESEK